MKNLFVGNMSFQTTEAIYSELFKASGRSRAFTSPWTARPAGHAVLPLWKCPMMQRPRRPSPASTGKTSAGAILR